MSLEKLDSQEVERTPFEVIIEEVLEGDRSLVDQYFDGDEGVALYCALLEEGYEPDEVFAEYGFVDESGV